MPRPSFRLFLLPALLLLLAGCLDVAQLRDRDDIRARLDQATGDTVFIYQSSAGAEPGLMALGRAGYKVMVNGKAVGVIGDQSMLGFAIPRGPVVIGVNVFDFDALLQQPLTHAIDNKGQGPYFLRILTRSNLLVTEAVLVPVSRADFEAAVTRPIR